MLHSRSTTKEFDVVRSAHAHTRRHSSQFYLIFNAHAFACNICKCAHLFLRSVPPAQGVKEVVIDITLAATTLALLHLNPPALRIGVAWNHQEQSMTHVTDE